MCHVYYFSLSFLPRSNNMLGAQKNVTEFSNREVPQHALSSFVWVKPSCSAATLRCSMTLWTTVAQASVPRYLFPRRDL